MSICPRSADRNKVYERGNVEKVRRNATQPQPGQDGIHRKFLTET